MGDFSAVGALGGIERDKKRVFSLVRQRADILRVAFNLLAIGAVKGEVEGLRALRVFHGKGEFGGGAAIGLLGARQANAPDFLGKNGVHHAPAAKYPHLEGVGVAQIFP